ncbi:MAG TPA: class I SAM-dependent methyltransferase [Solirubrobacteraceae bacterium]|nr:class I SAM-dependent methyltransferase [Solirubrobacteraceae bacterium]
MVDLHSFRRQARATWSAGGWDHFARLISPVGGVVIDRVGAAPGVRLLDVGTGSAGNLAIPAAQLGAEVVGLDITPELLERAARRADESGVDIEWVERDAQELPFEGASFDRVTSTFGAMFAPDHQRTAGELVRVCRPGGRIAMTTWVDDGFVGELFTLTGSFMPSPPPGVQPPPLWGVPAHIDEVFRAVGAEPSIEREIVEFSFESVDDAVRQYAANFGPFVSARIVLEPQGRWEEFISAFHDPVSRFNPATDGTARIHSDYFVILIER